MRLDSKLSRQEWQLLLGCGLEMIPHTITSLADCANDCITGSVFFALRGVKHDGHDYIEAAIKSGAVLVVGERQVETISPFVKVAEVRKTLAQVAAAVSQFPSRRLLSLAVTGTNGKTTTHCILASILKNLNHRPVLRTGTLGAYLDDTCLSDDTLTTPGTLQLNKLLASVVKDGAKAWCTEASSHALDQERLSAIDLDGAIFTNLTRDHLDYHQTMENYFLAKAKLFSLLGNSSKKNKIAVIHLDDIWGEKMLEHARGQGCRVISFGQKESDIRILKQEHCAEGTLVNIADKDFGKFTFTSPLLGAHNVENVVGAYALLTRTVCTPEEFLAALLKMSQVPGRLELVVKKPYKIFVDYAHTPDALERVLAALKEICTGKLWVLFGCGGDRDKGKRPQMLAAALRLADRVVVTSDNPRTEDRDEIIKDILVADIGGQVKEHGIIDADRRSAIQKAINRLESNDILVIAGKGHEAYQIIGQTKQHFSDQEEVRKYLKLI